MILVDKMKKKRSYCRNSSNIK